jgi:NAD(P)-dependent dehydrogenase (short-subunit alcohol dehydrogenase family)
LRDRGVLVTGAASGIGRSCAQLFIEVGARVCALDVNEEGLASRAGDAPGPGQLTTVAFDLRQIGEFENLLDRVESLVGPLRALVNVAAALRRQPLADVTEADWDFHIDTNLKSAFFLNRAIGERMRAAGGGGRIINFSSGAWLTGPAYHADAYVTSKGGIVVMARGLARQLGPYGILVNTIAPGQVDTPMQWRDNDPEMVEQLAHNCPLRRMAAPREIALTAVFLASDHASYVNGATLNVSGGSVMY